MSLRRCWLLIGLCALCQGCNLAVLFSRNVVSEFERATDECWEKARDHRLAVSAWNDVQKSVSKGFYSSDYERGFKDGYEDYLYAGGTGEAPPMPPRHYWGVGYETPEGAQAIQDWSAGYQHGAAAAEQSGYRQLIMVSPFSPNAAWDSEPPISSATEVIAPPPPPPTGPLPGAP